MDKETMLRAEAAREMMVRVEKLKAIHTLERSYSPVYLKGYTGGGRIQSSSILITSRV